jgi:hypothetical protein
MEGEKEGLLAANEWLESELEALQSTTVHWIEQKKTALESEVEALKTTNHWIEQKKVALESEVEALQTTNHWIEQEKEGLEKEFSWLEDENQWLEQQQGLLQERIDLWEKQKREWNADALQWEERLAEEVGRLEATKSEFSREIEAARAEIEAFESARAVLKGEQDWIDAERQVVEEEKTVNTAQKLVIESEKRALEEQWEEIRFQRQVWQREKCGLRGLEQAHREQGLKLAAVGREKLVVETANQGLKDQQWELTQQHWQLTEQQWELQQQLQMEQEKAVELELQQKLEMTEMEQTNVQREERVRDMEQQKLVLALHLRRLTTEKLKLEEGALELESAKVGLRQLLARYERGELACFAFGNGETYVGEQKGGARHGHGIMTAADGSRYEGLWRYGRRHGQGTTFHADGRREEGVFDRGAAVAEKRGGNVALAGHAAGGVIGTCHQGVVGGSDEGAFEKYGAVTAPGTSAGARDGTHGTQEDSPAYSSTYSSASSSANLSVEESNLSVGDSNLSVGESPLASLSLSVSSTGSGRTLNESTWARQSAGVTVTEEGRLAIRTGVDRHPSVVFGSVEMSHGRHYVEVRIGGQTSGLHIGVAKAGLCTGEWTDFSRGGLGDCTGKAWFMHAACGSLCGGGGGGSGGGVDKHDHAEDVFEDEGSSEDEGLSEAGDCSEIEELFGCSEGAVCSNERSYESYEETRTPAPAGPLAAGDRLGLLVDLDDGSLLFFKNGVQHGTGYGAGSVKGPVVLAMQMKCFGQHGKVLEEAAAQPADEIAVQSTEGGVSGAGMLLRPRTFSA